MKFSPLSMIFSLKSFHVNLMFFSYFIFFDYAINHNIDFFFFYVKVSMIHNT